MRARIQRWGNSLALRHPESNRRRCQASAGIGSQPGHDRCQADRHSDRRATWDLDELLKEVTPDKSCTARLKAGRLAGVEAW